MPSLFEALEAQGRTTIHQQSPKRAVAPNQFARYFRRMEPEALLEFGVALAQKRDVIASSLLARGRVPVGYSWTSPDGIAHPLLFLAVYAERGEIV